MSIKLYPYNMASESAKDLAQLLNVKRVRPDGEYVPRVGDFLIGWGASRVPDWYPKAVARGVGMLNKPAAVKLAVNKLTTLQKLKSYGISVPDFTTDMNQARQWLATGHTVVERHELSSNSGEGIRIVNLDDDSVECALEYAPLYTKFMNKQAEFRVHVFKGKVIDYIEKRKLTTERRPPNFDRYVSSTTRGWVFARTNIRDIPEIKQEAINAVNVLGLDFGACDVIFSDGKAYVLEVNSSPGLAGTTLINYANAIRRHLGAPDLSADVVNKVLTKNGEVTTTAVNTLVGWQMTTPVLNRQATATPVQGSARATDEVVLKLDRQTALAMRALLAKLLEVV